MSSSQAGIEGMMLVAEWQKKIAWFVFWYVLVPSVLARIGIGVYDFFKGEVKKEVKE